MNRLWVRFSLIITAVVFMVTLLPVLYGGGVEAGLFTGTRAGQEAEEVDELLADLPPDVQALVVERMHTFARLYFARAFIGSSIIGILAGTWLSRMLAAPLQDLEKGAQAIAAQDLGHRVPEQGSQEIQAVARSFNQMASRLEQAESLRRNLLADVAHELRHPLHLLQGNLQAILDGVYPLEPGEIARLLDQTQHLTTLVNDLHDLAQAEAQQLPLHKERTNMAELVKETAVSFKPLAADNEIELRIELLGMPPILCVDPMRIRQALTNLLHNALVYTPAGGTITISVARHGEAGCEIIVQDTGIGLDPEQVPHIFNRFYQGDAARSRHQHGVGLGLAIVKAIVEGHEGQIKVSSTGKNQGSIFTIWLERSADCTD